MAVETSLTEYSYKPGSAQAPESLAGMVFLDSSHLVVRHILTVDADGDPEEVGTVLVAGDDYVIGGDGREGTGTITALGSYPADDLFHVERVTPAYQQADLNPHEALPAEAVEMELDRRALREQELGSAGDRALKMPRGEKGGVLPSLSAMVGKFPSVDAGNRWFPSAGTGADAGLRADMANANVGTRLMRFLTEFGTDRLLEDKLRDMRRIKDFGAVGNGVADDRAAFAGADGLGPFHVTEGSYSVQANLTIANRVRFEPGAKIVVPAGVTLTLNGGIEAGPHQIFDVSGGGTVVIDCQFTPWGWAEWWGLAPQSPGAAATNRTRINAAIAALRETCLLAKTYYTDGQLTINGDNKRLIGSGKAYNGVTEGQVTRILCSSATAHILYMGATAFVSVAELPEGMHVEGLFLGRTAAPDITSSCAGLYMKWCKFSSIDDVKTTNSQYGFRYGGTVHCKVMRPHAIRSAAGTGGADTFTGHFVDGAENIGLNGSNASLYLIDPVVEGNQAIPGPGIHANNWNTDLFIVRPETSFTTTGIEIEGNGDNAAINARNVDVTIIDPKLDSFAFAGIHVHAMNQYGSVEIVSGYYGAKAGATACILIDNNKGAVNVLGGQLLLNVATTTRGIRINQSNNVTLRDPIINEATNAAVELDTAKNCRIEARVKNYGNVCTAAVRTYNEQTGNRIACMVSGGANKVSIGYQVLGTNDNRCLYDMSGVDSACIGGGSGNKLLRNGVQITATGLSGTNMVAGVMA